MVDLKLIKKMCYDAGITMKTLIFTFFVKIKNSKNILPRKILII